ncbi:hypothetical protein [Burkholderia cenocepacia]|uniref:hypothetical protein n=1 Tax=Burkholderia cenocepacia TaxID=95486 RepID=UPI00076148F7|nr:hypothetical protein [Burkholderia cenocepacia]KWU26322.1 hypothetical protein AS149_25360 [Burkholderia cenocepacia]
MLKFLPTLVLAAVGVICHYLLPQSTSGANFSEFSAQAATAFWTLGVLTASGALLAARERIRQSLGLAPLASPADIFGAAPKARVGGTELLALLAQSTAIVVGFRIDVFLPALALVVQYFAVSYVASATVLAIRLVDCGTIRGLHPDEISERMKRIDGPLLFVCWPSLLAALLLLAS